MSPVLFVFCCVCVCVYNIYSIDIHSDSAVKTRPNSHTNDSYIYQCSKKNRSSISITGCDVHHTIVIISEILTNKNQTDREN